MKGIAFLGRMRDRNLRKWRSALFKVRYGAGDLISACSSVEADGASVLVAMGKSSETLKNSN
jgi:hypothetical protein